MQIYQMTVYCPEIGDATSKINTKNTASFRPHSSISMLLKSL